MNNLFLLLLCVGFFIGQINLKTNVWTNKQTNKRGVKREYQKGNKKCVAFYIILVLMEHFYTKA